MKRAARVSLIAITAFAPSACAGWGDRYAEDYGQRQAISQARDKAWEGARDGFAAVEIDPSESAWYVFTFFAQGVTRPGPTWYVRMITGHGQTEGVTLLPNDALKIPPASYYAHTETRWASSTDCPGVKTSLRAMDALPPPDLTTEAPGFVSWEEKARKADGTGYRFRSRAFADAHGGSWSYLEYVVRDEGPLQAYAWSLVRDLKECWKMQIPAPFKGK
jgi:hypothetical protein